MRDMFGGVDFWDKFCALAELWKSPEETALRWHSALSLEQKTFFLCAVSSLSGSAVSEHEALTGKIDEELSESGKRALAALFRCGVLSREVFRKCEGGENSPKRRKQHHQGEEGGEEGGEEIEKEKEREKDLVLPTSSPSLSLSVSEEHENDEQQQHEQQQHEHQQHQERQEEDSEQNLPDVAVHSFLESLASAARSLDGQSQHIVVSDVLSDNFAAGLARPGWAEALAQRCASQIDEGRLAVLTQAVMSAESAVSTKGKIAVLRSFVLPRVLALEGPPSRLLLQIGAQCMADAPRAALNELLLPALLRGAAGSCELVSRVLEISTPEEWEVFLLGFAEEMEHQQEQRAWSDGILALLLRAVQGAGGNLSERACAGLISAASLQLTHLAGNARLAKLVLAIAGRRSCWSEATLRSARELAAQLSSFLGKTVVQKLN